MSAPTPPEALRAVPAPQFAEQHNATLPRSGMRLSTFLMRLIGVCVLPLVLLAAWLVFNSVLSTQGARDQEAAGRAKDVATAIDSELNARIGALHMLAASPLADDPSRWKDLYREAQGFNDSFGSHVILASVGDPMRMLFNTRVPFGAELPLLPRPKGHAGAPAAVETGKPAVGDTFPGPIAKQTLVAIAVPVLRQEKTRYLLLTTIETRRFQQRIELAGLPPDWALSLLDGKGDVIARRAPMGFDPTVRSDAPGRFVVRSTVSPWSVVLEIPRDVYWAPMRAATTALVAAIFAATLLAVLGGVLAGRRLSRSVASLTQTPVAGAPLPEIAEIAQARLLLDQATRRRDAAVASQRTSEERLRATFELAAVGIAHVAPDGSWLSVNQKLCDIVGYTRDELLARSLQDITHPVDLDRDLDHVRRLLASEIPTYSMEKRYLRKDGESVPVNLAVALVRKDSGDPDYFISVIEDISKRKRLEERNREQFEELARSEADGKRLLALAERSRSALLNVLQDQKMAADALSESSALLRIAGGLARFGGWSVELAEGKVHWSDEVAAIHEMPAGYCPPVDAGIRFYAPEWRDRIGKVFDACARVGTPYDEELEIITASGKRIWVRSIGEAIRDESGKIIRVQGAFQDINERRRAEEALRASDAQFRTFVAASSDVIYRMSPDWTEMRQLDGRGFIVDTTKPNDAWFQEYIPVDDQPRVMEAIREAIRTKSIFELEHRVRRVDGTLGWTFSRAIPVFDAKSEIDEWFGAATDVTERKQAESELIESERRYRALFENMTAGFALYGVVQDDRGVPTDLCIVAANKGFELTTGLKLQDVIGKRLTRVLPGIEDDAADWIGTFAKVALSGEARQLEQRSERLGIHYSITAYQSGPKQCAVTFVDITERKQAENEVRRLHEELQRHAADLERRVIERTAQFEAAKIRAEAADRVKSAFLATMSHELRTPLNSIIGFTGIMLQKLPGPLNAEQEKQLGFVRNASRHLLALINDVLDISKVEAGELHLARERFDLRALLGRLGTAFALETARRGLAFNLNIGDNESIVTGDARRVEQVLNNLLSNALKFTPEGSISLSCSREGDSFTIAVVDTGVGIKADDMDKLFRPFSQIETGLPELREGTGLGLAISRHLVEAMGGQISAASEWGKGSRFTFALPAGGNA